MVIAVLLAGKWALAEWQAYRSVSADLALLQNGQQQAETERSRLTEEVKARTAKFHNASIGALDARIGEISQSLSAKSDQQTLSVLSFPLPRGSQLAADMVSRSKRALEIELLTQERDFLVQLRASVNAGMNRRAATENLEQLRQRHIAVYETLQENKRQQEQLKKANPFKVWIPGTPERTEFSEVEKAYRKLRIENALAHKAFLEQKAALGRIATFAQVKNFSVDQSRIDTVMAPLRNSLAQGNSFFAKNWFSRFSGPVMEVVPTAALLALSIFLIPIAIKLLFYYVLAPLASRLRAIVVDRNASGAMDTPGGISRPLSEAPRISAVSQSVSIDENDELLIHSEYIQSLSIGGMKNTKWLFDWSTPFTSMAAALVAMTRVHTDRRESIVISPTEDPLTEIAIINLPAGSAMVFQPRGLIGVAYPKSRPLTITPHWRLNSLHAWLTLQLRYLVFRGPVTLIVKGCRGVRLEAAGSGRSISQSATLGFSANLAYSTIRSETFFPYLIGKHALFHDRFDGDAGYYVYEETPRGGKKPGIFGRGIEGLTDSVLKIFGI